jgi:hypothetical protein
VVSSLWLDSVRPQAEHYNYKLRHGFCATHRQTAPLCRLWHRFEFQQRAAKDEFHPLFAIVLSFSFRLAHFGIFIALKKEAVLTKTI